MERIGIFHHKFARAHHAETWTAFVAEFGVDVVEIFRQLFVGVDFFADDVGDHLFAGGAEAEFVVVAVGNPQQFVAVKIPAARLFPQVGRLDDGHQKFDGAGAVHFFAHDVFHFPQHAQAHRHPCVQARCVGFNQAGAQHELVAGQRGFGRGFFEGGDEELGGFHSRFSISIIKEL